MIETARLILRQYRDGDRAPFRAMMADPDVMHDYPAPFTTEEADAYFERRRGQIAAHGFGKWAIERRADGDFLGFVGVSEAYPTLPVAPSLEIGWRLVRGAWGQGYASEAARAALTDAFERTGAERILAFTLATNQRSLAVMHRLGLERDAGRDFVFETGLPAAVYVARRGLWTAAA
jgi:RimJ/RimL family protein N-acetyltransferase